MVRSQVQLSSTDGREIGTSSLCVRAERYDGALYTQVGTLTLHVPGGRIDTAVTIVDDFTSFPSVTQTLSGVVTGGDGVYRGAAGLISGGGAIAFDAAGAHPDLTFAIDLG